MVEIIPSILTADITEVREKIIRAEELVKNIQIDIIDGQFVANKTIDPSAMESVETNLNLDFHLMTKDPIDWVERAVNGGAERIIGQIEMMTDQTAFVGKVQEVGMKVGLAIDLPTPVEAIDQEILTSLDVVLVMSVKAGFSGQTFDENVWDKIAKLVEARDQNNSTFRICVDGGITPELVKKLSDDGVNEIVIGKRLFEGDLAGNLEKYTIK